jgi:hypothetical protein
MTALLRLPGPAMAAAAQGYTLHLFNIDDYAVASVNGRRVMTCGYKKTCSKSLDRYLRQGPNTIKIKFGNKSSGYSWGYAIKQNGRGVAQGSCGRAGRRSCAPGQPRGIFKTVVERLD